MGDKLLYTGTLDSYYDFVYGDLEYRSLRFETEILEQENYQGVAVVNYTDSETPFTRMIEHKHFENNRTEKTVITREYPAVWKRTKNPTIQLMTAETRNYIKSTQSLLKKKTIHFLAGDWQSINITIWIK